MHLLSTLCPATSLSGLLQLGILCMITLVTLVSLSLRLIGEVFVWYSPTLPHVVGPRSVANTVLGTLRCFEVKHSLLAEYSLTTIMLMLRLAMFPVKVLVNCGEELCTLRLTIIDLVLCRLSVLMKVVLIVRMKLEATRLFIRLCMLQVPTIVDMRLVGKLVLARSTIVRPPDGM